jgi:hypothetical protein
MLDIIDSLTVDNHRPRARMPPPLRSNARPTRTHVVVSTPVPVAASAGLVGTAAGAGAAAGAGTAAVTTVTG